MQRRVLWIIIAAVVVVTLTVIALAISRYPPGSSEDYAAWVGAGGTVLALLLAIYAALTEIDALEHQRKEQAAREAESREKDRQVRRREIFDRQSSALTQAVAGLDYLYACAIRAQMLAEKGEWAPLHIRLVTADVEAALRIVGSTRLENMPTADSTRAVIDMIQTGNLLLGGISSVGEAQRPVSNGGPFASIVADLDKIVARLKAAEAELAAPG